MVEGETVPLSQALEEWRSPKDVTRFPQVATELHRIKQHEEEIHQEHQANIQLLQRNMSAMVASVGEEDNIDWDRARVEMGPEEYIQRKEKFDARRNAFQAAFQQIKEFEDGASQREDQARQDKVGEEAAMLMKIMPSWAKDKKVAEKARVQMQATATDVGLSDKDIDGLTDHRHVLLLWKASEFDRLMRMKRSKLPGLKQLPRVSLRASSRRAANAEVGENRLKILNSHRKTGTQESAAQAIKSLLSDEL